MKKQHFCYKDVVLLTNILSKCISLSTSEIKTDLSYYIDTYNLTIPKKIDEIIRKYFSSLVYLYNRFYLEDGIAGVINSFCILLDIQKNKFYTCPVYGKISAGQPNWAEESLDGYLPIDPNLMGIVNPEECFFLRVNGESMNKVVKNGAYALIRKTDWVENGEICVILINGYEATLKKFSQQGDLIILEPMSNDPSFTAQVYNKDTQIKILGKYIGKFEINK